MIKRDDELRLSDEVQSLYRKKDERDLEWKCTVTENVRRRVCHEFGLVCEEEVEIAIGFLNSALYFFPSDPEILSSAHYLKNNVFKQCPLQVGDLCPDIQLHSLSSMSAPVSLREFLLQSPSTKELNPLHFLLVGSYT